ncbi:inturned [Oopsacas minuta]|uniref:Inturned planar cell polarity effector homolog n=1 Tax=Oopsacas minuta TaxID=111878 RepID=A0A142F4Y3_9METZ|nr:inturned [Oopsacas minuta]KAI6653603.1 inturned [Oopsacas minuta]
MAQEAHKPRLPSQSKIKSKFVPLKATHHKSFDALSNDPSITSQKPPQSPFPSIPSFIKQKLPGRHSRTGSTSSVQSLDMLQTSGSNFSFETPPPISQFSDDIWVTQIHPVTGNIFYIDIQPIFRRKKHYQSTISLNSVISDISAASAPIKPIETPGTSPSLSSKRKLKLSQLFPHRTLGRSKKKNQQSPMHKPARNSTISLDEGKLLKTSLPESPKPFPRSKSVTNSIYLNLKLPQSDRDSNPITKLDSLTKFGIIIQQPRIKSSKSFDDLLDGSNAVSREKHTSLSPVIIQSIIQDSPASIDGSLRSMDKIVSIDNNNVTQDNIHIILDKLKNKPQLTLEIQKEQYSNFTYTNPDTEDVSGESGIAESFARLVAGKETFENIAKTSEKDIGTYLCLYMTINDKNQVSKDQGMDDLVFYYPHQPIPKNIDSKDPAASSLHKLVAVRGMFYTLADVVQSISGLAGDRATLETTNGEIVHAAFKLLPNKEIVVIIAPENVVEEKTTLCNHLDTFIDALTFQFGNVSNAFMQQSNLEELDHLCCLLFSNIYRTVLFDQSDVFISNLMASQTLRINSEINTEINSLLSELNASDLSDQPEISAMQRPYHTLGSCLYYKGYIICSQLPASYQREVNLYCSYHGLLNLTSTQSVGQIVIWKQVFTSNVEPPSTPKTHKNISFKCLGGKYFLLLVGLGQALCAQILLAGPMATRLLNLPPPDPLLVDRIKEMLDELERYGLFSDLEEKSFNTAHLPPITNPLVDSNKGNDRNTIFERNLRSSRSSLRTSGESTDSDGSTATKTQSRISLPLLDPQPQPIGKQIPYDSISFLTSSTINLLFHYLVFDELSGIFLTPPALPKHSSSSHSIQKDLVYIFHTACLCIREQFKYSKNWSKNLAKLNKKFKNYKSNDPELTLGEATESAFKFTWTVQAKSTKDNTILLFWVVGRRISRPKPCELYICYQDSTPQSTIEMAFKLLQSNII